MPKQKGGISTSTNSGFDTFLGVGVGTSIGTIYKILVDGSIGMLLWSSMATCAREGLDIFSEDGAFTTTSESMGKGLIIMGCNYCRWGQWLSQK